MIRQIIPLGSTQPTDMSPMLTAIAEQIAAEVRTAKAEVVEQIMGAVVDELRVIAARTPVVNVAPAAVTVNTPDIEQAPAVNITVPGLDALAARLTETNALLGQLLALGRAPVVTEVKRDGQYISSTIATRRP